MLLDAGDSKRKRMFSAASCSPWAHALPPTAVSGKIQGLDQHFCEVGQCSSEEDLVAFTTVLRSESPECPNLDEAGKVGNVLTISTSRCPARAHPSHVGLLRAARKVTGSRGQT